MSDAKRYIAPQLVDIEPEGFGVLSREEYQLSSEVILASDYDALRQQLEDRQHELDSLNICESCSPSDAANEKCPLCFLKFMREKDDAAFRQTITELEQQLEHAQFDNTLLRSANEGKIILDLLDQRNALQARVRELEDKYGCR